MAESRDARLTRTRQAVGGEATARYLAHLEPVSQCGCVQVRH